MKQEDKSSENKAYMYEYLEPLIDVTRLVFIMLNDMEKIDIVKGIDAYYQTLDVRLKMDMGNWMALNKGNKQILHSIDLSDCESNTPEKVMELCYIG